MGVAGGGAFATACNRKVESSSMKREVGFGLVRAAKIVEERRPTTDQQRCTCNQGLGLTCWIVLKGGIGTALDMPIAISG